MEDTISKAYKFRLYPNKQQTRLIEQTFGCCRFVYNHFLQASIDHYKTESKSLKVTSAMLTQLKQDTRDEDGHRWLYDVPASALVYETRHLKNAYDNFFRNVKRGIKPAGFPKFKSKCDTPSFSVQNNVKRTQLVVDYDTKRIKLPKLGWVKVVPHRPMEGDFVSCTVSRDTDGKYYVSCACQDIERPAPKQAASKEIAAEVGLRHYIVLSDGTEVDHPAQLEELERRIRHEKKILSRKMGGNNVPPGTPYSKRYRKQLAVVNRLQAKQRRIRNQMMHETTRAIVDGSETIFIRKNDVADMLKNKKARREIPRKVERDMHNRIADASFFEFRRQLEYKSDWYGRLCVVVDEESPTTRRCSECGYVNPRLAGLKGLTITHWTCPKCGTRHEREMNSAQNILDYGHGMLTDTPVPELRNE